MIFTINAKTKSSDNISIASSYERVGSKILMTTLASLTNLYIFLKIYEESNKR